MGQVAHSAFEELINFFMFIAKYIPKTSSNAVAMMFSANPGTYSWVGTYSWPSERPAPSNNNNNDSECYLVAGGGAKG